MKPVKLIEKQETCARNTYQTTPHRRVFPWDLRFEDLFLSLLHHHHHHHHHIPPLPFSFRPLEKCSRSTRFGWRANIYRQWHRRIKVKELLFTRPSRPSVSVSVSVMWCGMAWWFLFRFVPWLYSCLTGERNRHWTVSVHDSNTQSAEGARARCRHPYACPWKIESPKKKTFQTLFDCFLLAVLERGQKERSPGVLFQGEWDPVAASSSSCFLLSVNGSNLIPSTIWLMARLFRDRWIVFDTMCIALTPFWCVTLSTITFLMLVEAGCVERCQVVVTLHGRFEGD